VAPDLTFKYSSGIHSSRTPNVAQCIYTAPYPEFPPGTQVPGSAVRQNSLLKEIKLPLERALIIISYLQSLDLSRPSFDKRNSREYTRRNKGTSAVLQDVDSGRLETRYPDRTNEMTRLLPQMVTQSQEYQ